MLTRREYIRLQNPKKNLPCLRCGKKFLTTARKRTCRKCRKKYWDKDHHRYGW